MLSVKICTKCQQQKPPEAFYVNKRQKSGLNPRCKECHSAAAKAARHRPEILATHMWHDLNHRVKSQPEYAGVEVRISRNDFVAWAMPAITVWQRDNPGVRLSLDREDAAGHYEAGNIRIISLSENSRRSRRNKNVHAPEGHAWCAKCEAYRPVDDFHQHKRNYNGQQHYCRKCRSSWRKPEDRPREHNARAPEGQAWCGRCEAYLSRDLFYTCPSAYGVQSRCKKCQSDYAKASNAKKTP